MARDWAYREVEKEIEEARRKEATHLDLHAMGLTEVPEALGQLIQLRLLDLSHNQLAVLPEALGQLTQLRLLDLSHNQLAVLPEALGQLTQLQELILFLNQLAKLPETISQLAELRVLSLSGNKFTSLPDDIGNLRNLRELYVIENQIEELPETIGNLSQLRILVLGGTQLSNRSHYTEGKGKGNKLTAIPFKLAQLEHLEQLDLHGNPLNPELAAAYQEGLDAVKRYLRAKAGAQLVLNEAKLILVGEGEVGKSCLLGALRGDEWVEGRPTTHGIEIKPVEVVDPGSGTRITLNGWDFGGQRVYRPTHQLFFSAPAVYLVVWKPREGPQQGFIKEWIKLIKHREPEARILVVASHGGPGQRQPDVDRQELWDLFGRDTLLDFFHVDSKPDECIGERRGITELKDAIARVAAGLPGMGRTVPERWQQAREALKQTGAAYLSLERALKICRAHKMDREEARLFVTISHRLGHLIHYEHDSALHDIVVLKPDWLATAISFVLDDKQTRDNHGLVSFARLGQLWDDPEREEQFRYLPELHPVFLRLMERFDLSYRVAGLPNDGRAEATSLIAQLVPDVRPDPIPEWAAGVAEGDEQQVQLCRIVEVGSGQSATAEGLFYQLIVRLHKYSLGRVDYARSVHWQRGLMLDDDYNGRALLEHTGNDVRITVRAPYPERFLSVLTYEVKWLVESFWAGLRCEVMVPCVEPCGKGAPGSGLFEVQKLIESKRRRRPDYPCPICDEWQEIDCLLRNAPATRLMPATELFAGFAEVRREMTTVRQLLMQQHGDALGRFDRLDSGTQRILSKVDDAFAALMQTLTDEAKEGPRLFSLVPVDRARFNPKGWTSEKFRLTLWCEHSRLPLPALNSKAEKSGVYELELKREWVKKAAPFLKLLGGTLSLVLPVASSATKLILDDATYKLIEEELDFGRTCIEETIAGGGEIAGWLGHGDSAGLEHGEALRAQGAVLRELHALLKAKDPGFGGLVRVQNRRHEFLWVHSRFAEEY